MPDTLMDLWRQLISAERLGLYLTLGWLAYVLWLGLWIVLQKRAPCAGVVA